MNSFYIQNIKHSLHIVLCYSTELKHYERLLAAGEIIKRLIKSLSDDNHTAAGSVDAVNKT